MRINKLTKSKKTTSGAALVPAGATNAPYASDPVYNLWTYVKVSPSGLTFDLCTDLKKYHNGSVRSTTVLCRKMTDVKPTGDRTFFLLYKRPKGYWVAMVVLEKHAAGGRLVTVRDAISGKPLKITGNDWITNKVEDIFQEMFKDPKKYNNASHKNVKLKY